MAQLSDDCFAFGEELLTVDAAEALLSERITTLAGTERVPLTEALGRVVAEDIVSDIDVPGTANSAVDGYAVYADDLSRDTETRLPVNGRVAAGQTLYQAAARGEAVRIFTGAAMPEGENGGPDTVMMQEDCAREGDTVVIRPGIKRGANRREAGEDIRRGDLVLRAGQRLHPEHLGLVASVGHADLLVFAPLRVAVFSTGDELREPGSGLRPGQIHDSNRYTLIGLLQGLGCEVSDLGILEDSADRIQSALEMAAEDHDLIVTSGGVSVGDEDHVRTALMVLGNLHFWRLAIKPGRPIAMGVLKGIPFVGLPGNPVAVMVTFLRLVRPLVLRLVGAVAEPPRRYLVRAAFAHRKKSGRREWVRASLEPDHTGHPVAYKFNRDGAGILSSIARSEGLVELPEDLVEIHEGDWVSFLPFNEVR